MQQYTTFGQNLATLRKRANLSQDKLAEQLHITRQAVSKWESSISTPDIDTVVRLCRILQVTPNQLLIDPDSVVSTGEKEHPHADTTFVVTSIFLIVVFISGIALLIFNFSSELFEPQVTLLALFLMAIPALLYIILLISKGQKRRKT